MFYFRSYRATGSSVFDTTSKDGKQVIFSLGCGELEGR